MEKSTDQLTVLPIKGNLIKFAIIFAIFFCFYMIMGTMLMDSGVYSNSEIYYGAKAKLLINGPEPKINNYDFTDPPIQMLLYTLFQWNFQVASSLIGAFFNSFLLLFVLTNFKSKLIKIAFSITILTMPSFLFNSLEVAPYMLFLFFYCLGFYFLLEFSARSRVFYLFVFGLIYGILFLIRFEILWTSIYIYIMFYFIYRRKKKFLYYSTAALFPMFFLFLCWLFVYWIFRGNPLNFINHVFISHLTKGSKIFLDDLLSSIIRASIYIIFYILILFKIGKFRFFFISPAFLVFISPFFMSLLLNLFGMETNSVSYTIIYLINFIILLPYIGYLLNTEKRKLFIITLVVLVYVFDVFMLYNFGNREEKHFLGALNNKKYHYAVVEYREVAKYMNKYDSLLIDTDKSFRIVFFSERTDNVISDKNPEYYTYIVTPDEFVDAVIINKTGDSITKYFPFAVEAGITGFYTVFETEEYLVLENKKTGL